MSAFNSPSQTGGPVPDNSSSQQANSSSATPPPPPSQQHRIAVATARVPSMFRFNTQQQQQTSTATNPPNAVDLVRFECSVEPCGQRGQQPCQPKVLYAHLFYTFVFFISHYSQTAILDELLLVKRLSRRSRQQKALRETWNWLPICWAVATMRRRTTLALN